MGLIRIGTSGYSYREWVGPVYPTGTKSGAYLRCYTRRFATLELNYSYYRMPTASQLAALLQKAGGSLGFSIKAHASLTHEPDRRSWETQAKTFREALKPLQEARCLEAVLFQFPYAFHYEKENRRYLAQLLAAFEELPRVVEFRNTQWYREQVVQGLRERAVALAVVDLPPLAGLPPILEAVTAPLAYIRLHGRNQRDFWGSDRAARYDYRYSDGELASWRDRILRLQTQADIVLVYFNNHPKGQAAVNAQRLGELLGMG
ncbi:MAG: DUF72 domain-containing protein [Treponema sp.]|jgi:uncharacterized protein YecE (DUF72 family)|nr:DUF72 domain-containing protein [Treponema sp.]